MQLEEIRSEACEELQNTLEELRQQNDKLHACCQALETERQRYQELFEFAPVGYLVTDVHGNIQEANRAAADLLSTPQDWLIDKPLILFVAKEDHKIFRVQFAACLRQLEQMQDWELYLQPRGGMPFLAAINVAAMHDPTGKLVGLLWLLRDITKCKHLESQLYQLHKLNALGTLAGGIAHDFNTILALMLGNTELAIYDVTQGSEAWDALQEVLTAGRRGQELVQQILAFSGQDKLKREPVRLHSIINTVFTLLRHSLPAHIDICQAIDPTIDTVLANPMQMHQVLTNLCNNAVDAMRKTGGVLDLCLEAVEVTVDFATIHPPSQPGPHVRLTIKNRGHGIEHKNLERIFDPFFTTKEPGKGTGMGLAVVHGIVTQHGGVITVESVSGHGTTFVVYLPRITQSLGPKTWSPQSLTPLSLCQQDS